MKEIYLIGDIHGNFNLINYIIKTMRLKNCILIQVGDFGIGFYPKKDNDTLLNLNNKLSEANIEMYVIRGNHDCPSHFNGDHYYSNLKLLKDYEVLNLNNNNFLFVGGAVSVDRKSRIEEDSKYHRKSYWPDEKFYLDYDKLEEIDLNSIDMLITHSTTKELKKDMENCRLLRPEMVNQFIYMYKDFTLLEDIENESNNIQTLKDMLPNVTHHYFGHYHNEYNVTIDNCEYRLLNINQVFKHK